MFYICGLILICVVAESLQTNDNTIVALPNGKIRGRVEKTYKNVTFYAFDEIPFAKPPIGKLRFQAPEPIGNWDGILDTTRNTKVCHQMERNLTLENEDCLYLNVYTPVEPGKTSSLPVMYYIFGGGFIQGYCIFHNCAPQWLVEHGVIVVTVNYRTGPFGFLSTGDTIIPGNNGLKDQNMGLKWVQQNIHLFGGDPEKVTIFGQSAGSASVTYQIISKQSKGLFRGAIGESGSAISPWAYQRHAKNIAWQLASLINPEFSNQNTSEELRDYLQDLPEKVIKDAASVLSPVGVPTEQIVEGFYFAPVVEPEHEGAFITENMYTSVETGNISNVPLMIGICSEESIYRATAIHTFKNFLKCYESDPARLANEDLHIDDEEKRRNAGEEIRKIYTGGNFTEDLASAIRYFSDIGFTRSVIRWAELQSQYTDVYFYQFSYHGVLGGNKVHIDGAEDVGHSEDTRYIWGGAYNMENYPESDLLTVERYITLFTDFAKTLNPTPETKEVMQNITFPKVTSNNFQYLNINRTLEIMTNPKEKTYSAWKKIYDIYGVPPFDTY